MSDNLTYSPLNDEEREFRVLRIDHSHDDLVECELRKFSLDDIGAKWAALSYRWGSDEAEYTIRVNGEDFLVRPNLYSFLTRLAQARNGILASVEWIFIDAICIHQSDLSERAGQVMLMRDIYQKADLVVASLSIEDSPGAEIVKSREEPALYNTYWTRMWVVQEIFLAKQLIFVFGQNLYTVQELLGSIAESLGRGLPRGRSPPTAYLSDTSIITGMSATFSQERMNKMIPLVAGQLLYCLELQKSKVPAIPVYEAINAFSSQRCAVIHDKVFALLGIMKCHIQPDYTMPVIELYTQLLVEYLISLGLKKDSAGFEELRRHLVNHWESNFGQAILTILGVDPRDSVSFIVTRTVVCFFAGEDTRNLLHAIVIGRWLKFYQYDSERSHPFKKQWWKSIRKNATQILYDRSQELIRDLDKRLSKVRENGTTITDPVGGASRSISEWEDIALLNCQKIWTRHCEYTTP